MDDVLAVLRDTPGGIRVILYLEDEKKTLTTPVDYWVNEGFDRRALIAMLGPDAVVLK